VELAGLKLRLSPSQPDPRSSCGIVKCALERAIPVGLELLRHHRRRGEEIEPMKRPRINVELKTFCGPLIIRISTGFGARRI
jgi:hypothetical protein